MKTQRKAQAICQACPVADECREYALRHRVREGLWGSLTGRQRRDLRLVPKACGHCAAEFQPDTERRRYCSDDCRRLAHNAQSARTYRRRAS